MTVRGAVLTGGASRRMGRDKALLVVDGRVMAARVTMAMVDAGIGPVTCVGGDLVALLAAGLAAVADDHPGEGPLGGILTALALAHEDGAASVAVLACDLVAPSAGAIGRLLAAGRSVPDAAVVVPVTGGRPQWTHALWRTAALGGLRRSFADGERSVVGAAEATLAVHTYPESDALADADTAADLPGDTTVGTRVEG